MLSSTMWLSNSDKQAQHSLNRKRGLRFRRRESHVPLSELEPQTVRPAASRYTDHAVLATNQPHELELCEHVVITLL